MRDGKLCIFNQQLERISTSQQNWTNLNFGVLGGNWIGLWQSQRNLDRITMTILHETTRWVDSLHLAIVYCFYDLYNHIIWKLKFVMLLQIILASLILGCPSANINFCIFFPYLTRVFTRLSHLRVSFFSFCFLVWIAHVYLFYDSRDPGWPIAIRSTGCDFWASFFLSHSKRAFFALENERVFGWNWKIIKNIKTENAVLSPVTFSRVTIGNSIDNFLCHTI